MNMLDRREVLQIGAAGVVGLVIPKLAIAARPSAPDLSNEHDLCVRATHMLHDMLGGEFHRTLDPNPTTYPQEFLTTDGAYEYMHLWSGFKVSFDETARIEDVFLYPTMLSLYRLLTKEPKGKLLFCRRLPVVRPGVGIKQTEITFDCLSLRVTKRDMSGMYEPPIGPKIEFVIDGMYAIKRKAVEALDERLPNG